MSKLHVIFGTGPVGCWTARALREMDLTVRAINRSGKRPALIPEEVEIVKADASALEQAIEAAQGAAVSTKPSIRPITSGTNCFPDCKRARWQPPKQAGRATSPSKTCTCTTVLSPSPKIRLKRPKRKKASCAKKWAKK